MFTIKENYKAFSKIIISDYPYKINHYFTDKYVIKLFTQICNDLLKQHSKIRDKFYSYRNKGILDLSFMDHFLILSYRLSFLFSKQKKYAELANAIFYWSRFRTGCNIFYKVNINKYFYPIHPFGTIISPHAKYGKGLQIYHNVTIGHYTLEDPVRSSFSGIPKKRAKLKIGDWVIIFSNSTVMGNSVIGDNVILGLGTKIINRNVPSNTTVMTTENGKTIFMPNKNNNKKKFFKL